MANRLNITLFGSMYVVGAIQLPVATMRAGLTTYGRVGWFDRISGIALGTFDKSKAKKIEHTIGQSIDVVYHVTGIAMHDGQFGFESFWQGAFAPFGLVDAENRTLQPASMMQKYKSGDVLSVHCARRSGTLAFRWENVDELASEDVSLSYDSLSDLIPGIGRLELAFDLTWRDQNAIRSPLPAATLTDSRHVLHKAL